MIDTFETAFFWVKNVLYTEGSLFDFLNNY
jgi:hypothetical protein